MTFKDLCLEFGVISNPEIEMLYNLEINFGYRGNFKEYENALNKASPGPIRMFNSSIKHLIKNYMELSEKDREKAYIYVMDDSVDNPGLYIGVK